MQLLSKVYAPDRFMNSACGGERLSNILPRLIKEFIAGKFEDTLPIFFSEPRPLASVINFDADLYSSTICALNQSKSVMDKHTVLIFDEFIAHECWEQNEFKALNDFVIQNKLTYEVVAISFFAKQVAVKLIGIFEPLAMLV
jgi:hypothetical protein